MRSLIVLFIALSGAGLAVQAAVNARLREGVQSPALSALISFLVGAVLLLLLTLTRALGPNRLSGLTGLPWWAWTGGLYGAVIVMAALIGLPRIGAGGVVAATVFGQLVMALLLDSFGWLGVPRLPLSPVRIAGAVLLFVGVLLMQRK